MLNKQLENMNEELQMLHANTRLFINKNLETKKIKTNSTTYTKGISMEVNYLLIENSPITVLEVQ